MRLSTYRVNAERRAGIDLGTVLVDAERAALAAGLPTAGPVSWRSVKSVVQAPQAQLDELIQAAVRCASEGNAYPLDETELDAPVPDPQKIICLGLNYRAHAEEFDADAPIPSAPNLFAKFPSSLLGPRGTILIPSITAAVDFEGELAVVVGRRCKNVTADEALDHVAGCMAFNDVSARDLQLRTSQWMAGKAIDTFAPCGPALVSLDELGELGDLRLRTRVNGAVMQDAQMSEMIHSIPDTIAFLSRLMTLLPGDIIATGTPHGVGFRREPPIYLAPGDVVEVEIDGIGRLANEVAADPSLTAPSAVATASGPDQPGA
jgi:2-keto-4-pentenoate hydratase/2-oxohepta-3-ene-1,7-dioic acid hydratase in catechol pathway